MTTAAIIVAAGRGLRAGGDTPKQWQTLLGKSIVEHSLRVFHTHPRIDHLVLVLDPDALKDKLWPAFPPADIVTGGETRAASVMAGLTAIEGRFNRVLIHDGARPCVSHGVIDRVLSALETASGAAPAIALSDALWRGNNGHVTGTENRAGLFRAQTPQGFDLDQILGAHRTFSGEAADDVEIARHGGMQVVMVNGDEDNIKVTLPGDFARAERILGARMDIRQGNGFDVHRFGPGNHVTLCGIDVPFDRGLKGHSDADVGMHAVTDAIYGALAQGDIGRHFPPSDPQWKGAASAVFLAHAVEMARDMGYRIANVDCTLVCEHPKIGPHAQAMQNAMSVILGIGTERVSVKATTSEQLGFTGRGEGIAALASALLVGA